MKRIAILGTRGIPASYSGFETSVQETATRFVEKGYDVTVFCRTNHYKEKLSNYRGVKLKYLPSIKSKHLDTVTNTFLSILEVAKNKYDVVILYGVGNAYFIPLLKIFCSNVISVVDGADWEREKWGAFAKFVLSTGRNFAVKYADNYVVDNELLVQNYKNRFKKSPVYIPYGANIPESYNDIYLKNNDLEIGKYIVFIGRFVREKGIDFLISSFEDTNLDIKLVIIGGNDTDPEYVTKLKSTKDKRIVFPGFVYGNEYESILKFAKFYVSCSFLEGTSPSLLSAMAINGFALVSNLPENIEVLKGTCVTFEKGDKTDFIYNLQKVLGSEYNIESERNKTREIIMKYYTWEKITNQYIELFDKMVK